MPELQFSVVVPLEDTRGDPCEHLRSWTQQSFPRDAYQVVVACDGSDAAAERSVAALLEPHDRLVRTENSHVVGLWRAAVAQASAPWLILTEAHCRADPECLRATAAAIADEPALQAAMFTHGHVTSATPAELTARWFRYCYAEWALSEWAHLNLVGAAVRRDVFEEIDAFQPRYGLFCAHLLSARLHQRGALVGEVADAVVDHIYHDTLREHHLHSADSARGECEVRLDLDEEFCDRYFGRLDVWSQRLRHRPPLAREIVRALIAQARQADKADRRWLAREFAAWLPPAVAGARGSAAWQRLNFLAAEWATERLPLPAGLRWRGYLHAQDRIVAAARLSWIHRHVCALQPPAPALGSWTVEELDGATFVGAHAPEHRHDGCFRWTEPTAAVRLLPPRDGPHVLSIDTHGMRGAPLDYVLGVHIAGRPLPRRALSDDGERLLVELPAHIAPTAEGIVVLCRPYEPRREGSLDLRRLGMPVFAIDLGPLP